MKELIEYDAKLIEMMQPGNSVRVFYSAKSVDNPNNQVCHIRAIVDEQIVYRIWSYRYKSWSYRIVDMYEFHLRYIDGYLETV